MYELVHFPPLESLLVDGTAVEFLPSVHLHGPPQRTYTETSTSQPESVSLLTETV